MKPKVLFVVSGTAQAETFKSIVDNLSNWDNVAILPDRWKKRTEVENVLRGLNFPHKTIPRRSMGKVKEVFSRERPDIIVVGNDINLMQTLFIKCANSMGIPTLLVQDGIIAESRLKVHETGSAGTSLRYWITLPFEAFKVMMRRDYPWQGKIEDALLESRYSLRGKRRIYGHGQCSKMALFGEASKRMLISEGIAPERIVVTGNPKFDEVYYSKDSDCKKKVCERWNIPTDKTIILLLTQYLVEVGRWTTEQRRKFVLAVANAAAVLPNTQLIIKLHPPHESEGDYQEIVKGSPHAPIICKYASLPELLNACSLAVTVESTAGLEAMAIGKPVVIVNLFNESGPSLFNGSGALFVDKEENILPAMQKALYDAQTREEMAKSMKDFVYQQAYLQDGQASKRIADLIIQLAQAGDNYSV